MDRRRGVDRRRGSAQPPDPFDELPYGLLVLDRSGLLLRANPAARRLLPSRHPLEGGSTRCCDLFGCRRRPGMLGSACFAEIAADVLPERTPIPIEPSHAWPGQTSLQAVTLGVDPSWIVVQLTARDARVPPGPAMPASLRIHTLGRTHVETAAGTVDGPWLDQRPGEVLQYLVCERRRTVPTDEIAEAIWPNARMSSVANVRFAVYDLRRRLEPDRPNRGHSSFIVSGKGTYRLDMGNADVDADDFDLGVEKGIAMLAGGRPAAAAASLDRALELYKGEFLSDAPYAPWAALERSRLHELAVKALRLRVEIARNAGDTAGVVEHVARLGRLEPYDIEIQRQWISTSLRLGRYGEASRHYGDLRQRMTREFGQRPPFELGELLEDGEQHQLSLI